MWQWLLLRNVITKTAISHGRDFSTTTAGVSESRLDHYVIEDETSAAHSKQPVACIVGTILFIILLGYNQ